MDLMWQLIMVSLEHMYGDMSVIQDWNEGCNKQPGRVEDFLKCNPICSDQVSRPHTQMHGLHEDLGFPFNTFTSYFFNTLYNIQKFLSTTSHHISLKPFISKKYLPLGLPNYNFLCIFHPSDACYMTLPSHPSWADQFNNIYWWVKIMKLLIIQISPTSCYFLIPNDVQ
jgi:hypothetical protein